MMLESHMADQANTQKILDTSIPHLRPGRPMVRVLVSFHLGCALLCVAGRKMAGSWQYQLGNRQPRVCLFPAQFI